MILDTHMHTAEYSPDSFLPIAEAVARAREMVKTQVSQVSHCPNP